MGQIPKQSSLFLFSLGFLSILTLIYTSIGQLATCVYDCLGPVFFMIGLTALSDTKDELAKKYSLVSGIYWFCDCRQRYEDRKSLHVH